jgi:hypothetical protein
MEKKINIAELLKDCPRGMELYSPIFGNVYLDKIRPHLAIVVTTDKEQGDFKEEFLYDGRYGMNGECMLFPSKDKTTWEGFVPPCKFKDGDIISDSLGTCIFKGEGRIKGTVNYYCGISDVYFHVKDDKLKPDGHYGDIVDYRLATEEEKQKLFDAIKANGYKWNSYTNTLEKLVIPRFNVGDKVKDKNNRVWFVVQVSEKHFDISSVPNAEGYFVPIDDQDNYELVPNKFDITTLKPFESKVLVRNVDGDLWKPAIYGFSTSKGCYVVGGVYWSQRIPYEGNEHLLGTTDDCDEYYKIWL